MKITCKYQIKPKEPSLNTAFVLSQFGIGFNAGENVIAEDVEIDYQPGKIILFAGPSGSGKSSLLRATAKAWKDAGHRTETFEIPHGEKAIALPPEPLIDLLGPNPENNIKIMGATGLADATIMLRSIAELSDGQRYRAMIARAIASDRKTIIADEWCSCLDRVTAKVLCRNVRRIAAKEQIGFLLATAHDDLIDDLQPDIIVRCDGKGGIAIEARPFAEQDQSASFESYGLAKGLDPTGRTSLGGITEATA